MDIRILLIFLLSNFITMMMTEKIVGRTHKDTIEQMLLVIDNATEDSTINEE